MKDMRAYYYIRFPEGKPKAITLSYDDGVFEDVRFIELMKQYGFKGTFNLSYNRIPADQTIPEGKNHRKLTAEEIREVYTPDCTEIAMHSFNHRSLASVQTSEVMYEIIEDRKVLEKASGHGITMKKRKVFCTDSIFCEYIHLPEIKETGAELIEMETAGFYECINAMEKKGIALLCVSDNSAADIALVMRDEESTKRYKTAREDYIPKLIDLICEL